MLYVNDSVPSSYKYLCDYGSNYFILTTDSFSTGSSGDPDVLSSYLCYLSPSFSCVPINYYTYESTRFTDISDYLTTDLHYAKDFPITLVISFLVLFCLCFIINGFTRIVLRGGVLFNK